MPLQHAVTYQAFREITNFIRNNGDDCDEFCVSTTRATRKPTTPTRPFDYVIATRRLRGRPRCQDTTEESDSSESDSDDSDSSTDDDPPTTPGL